MVSFFGGVAGFWSLLLPNWPNFEQILDSFQVKQTIWKKLKGFANKLKDFAKKTQPFGVKWLGKTPKIRSKNKPAVVFIIVALKSTKENVKFN